MLPCVLRRSLPLSSPVRLLSVRNTSPVLHRGRCFTAQLLQREASIKHCMRWIDDGTGGAAIAMPRVDAESYGLAWSAAPALANTQLVEPRRRP